MKPITSVTAMFLWAVLIIAIVGAAVSLSQSMWVPNIAWAIVAIGTAGGLRRQHHRGTGGARAPQAASARLEHGTNRDRTDKPGPI